MKDIFIDTNIAKNFSNPLSGSYKTLIKWFFHEDGCLVVSDKLISEYKRGASNATSLTNISAIIDFLTRNGRLNKIEKNQLNGFSFSKQDEKRLTCNFADQVHLKTVFLSFRKLAISNDLKLRNDINNFRKVDKKQPRAVAKPDDVNYKTYA